MKAKPNQAKFDLQTTAECLGPKSYFSQKNKDELYNNTLKIQCYTRATSCPHPVKNGT